MKIFSCTWSTLLDGRVIGIVWGEDDHTKERKCYAGIIDAGTITTEAADAQRIVDDGAPVDVTAAAAYMRGQSC